MAVVNLTQKFVDTKLISTGKSAEYVDSLRSGLYIKVTKASSGTGTYYLRYKNSYGKTAHHKIARTTEISLAKARQGALSLKAQLASGVDLQEQKKAKNSSMTLSELFTDHFLPYCYSKLRSANKYESIFRCHLQDEWGGIRLENIKRRDAQLLHMNLRETKGLSPAQADHVIKTLRVALNWALDNDIIMKNPIARFKLFNESNIVNNILTEEELNRFICVLQTDKNRMTCLVVLWLLSTGSRLNTALSARWEHINRNTRTWIVPGSVAKNGKQASIVLNDTALSLLPQLGTEGKYEHLFINFKTGTRLKSIHTGFKALKEKAGITSNFRIHDCRHQFASHCINNGRSLYEVSQLLNHSTPLISARYAHLSTKTLYEAAQCASLPLQQS